MGAKTDWFHQIWGLQLAVVLGLVIGLWCGEPQLRHGSRPHCGTPWNVKTRASPQGSPSIPWTGWDRGSVAYCVDLAEAWDLGSKRRISLSFVKKKKPLRHLDTMYECVARPAAWVCVKWLILDFLLKRAGLGGSKHWCEKIMLTSAD